MGDLLVDKRRHAARSGNAQLCPGRKSPGCDMGMKSKALSEIMRYNILLSRQGCCDHEPNMDEVCLIQLQLRGTADTWPR